SCSEVTRLPPLITFESALRQAKQISSNTNWLNRNLTHSRSSALRFTDCVFGHSARRLLRGRGWLALARARGETVGSQLRSIIPSRQAPIRAKFGLQEYCHA